MSLSDEEAVEISNEDQHAVVQAVGVSRELDFPNQVIVPLTCKITVLATRLDRFIAERKETIRRDFLV